MEAFIQNLDELAEHCDFVPRETSKLGTELLSEFWKNHSQKLQMRLDLNLDTATQMACQSKLVKFQVAGQSDTKHLGEVHQKKGKPHSARRPVRNMSDKKPKNSPPV